MELYIASKNQVKKKDKFTLVKNIVLISYVIVETLCRTVIEIFFQIEMERLQCILAISLIGILIYRFIKIGKNEKKTWCKKNIYVLIYFLIRLITFIYLGCQYTMLRSMLFEIVYLLAISELLVDYKVCYNIIFKFLIISNLILNILNTCFYVICTNISKFSLDKGVLIYDILDKYTYIDVSNQEFNSSMYNNPNMMGLMTGIALLISISYFSINLSKKKKIAYIIYFIFSLYCILYSNCSNAHVALIAVVLAVIIVKNSNIITKKRMVVICFAFVIAATGSIYVFSAIHEEFGEYSELENIVNDLSTQRYTIWKDSFYCHKDELLFGSGNITLEKRDRYMYIVEKGTDYGMDVNGSLIDFSGPHNGYIGMISCTGIVGFVAFVLVVLKKIKESMYLNSRSWYLAAIFILFINLFECMMPISKNFCCLYLFIILTMNCKNEVYK